MNKPVSFIYENVRYTTLFCDDEFLRTALEPGSNVANCAKIMSSGGFNVAFKKAYGMQVRDIPLIKNPEIIKNGNIFIVSGKAVIDGVLCDVKVNAVGVEISGGDEELKSVEPVKNVEVIIKPEPEIKPQIPTPKQESKTEIVQEKPVVKEPEKSSNVKEHDDFVAKMFGQKTGIGFLPREGNETSKPREEMLIGGESNNVVGILVQGAMYNSNKKTTIDRDARLRRISGNAPVQGFVEEPEDCPEKSSKSYQSAKSVTPMKSWEDVLDTLDTDGKPVILEKPVEMDLPKFKGIESLETPIQHPPIEVSVEDEYTKEESIDVTENNLRKEDLRAKFSKEVNAVIGDIPLDLLGSIAEFTMRPVDEDKLKKNGIHYCIDGRWHKSGDWFCIDVVAHSARFFYNAKKNIMIEIPVQDCKDWLKAVS